MKNRVKRICCIATMFAMTVMMVPVASAQSVMAENSVETMGSEARTEYKEWRYKVIGDHLYKRLYNASTGLWETDWILVA